MGRVSLLRLGFLKIEIMRGNELETSIVVAEGGGMGRLERKIIYTRNMTLNKVGIGGEGNGWLL